jgi:methyl-accepting chemotaxis protein
VFNLSRKSSAAASIAKATAVCNAIADGDFEARITNLDEDGELAELFEAINRVVDFTDAYIRESSAAMAHVAEKEYYRKIVPQGLPGAFANGATIINSAIDKMAQVNTNSVGLGSTVKGLVETVNEKAGEITNAAKESVTKTDTTTSKSLEVSEASRRSSQNVGAVAAATEELTASSAEIARQITSSATAANQALVRSESAGQKMSLLTEAADNIGSVVELITDIAGQTNLLALNATIEAARAGEAGKGFAVVASEVKNLANQTSKATETIITQVSDIQNMTNEAVSEINEVQEISRRLDDVTSNIAAAVEQQNAAQSEISEQVRRLSDEIEIVSENVVEVVQASVNSYSSSIQVIWSAGDLEQPMETLDNEMKDFLKIIS